MRYIYSYKTPDGARHGGELEARSRDDAFAELRRRGIRAIRVEPAGGGADGRRAWPWLALAGALSAICVVCLANSLAARIRYREGSRLRFDELKSKADAIKMQYEAGMRLLDLRILDDYSLIAAHADLSSVTNETRKAREVLSLARAQAGDLFRGVLEMFPPESVNERIDAQKMYGELMNGIDATEGRIRQDERALELLDANRGRWRVDENSRLVFDDARLRMEIEFFGRDKDDATVRWKKDFGNALKKEQDR